MVSHGPSPSEPVDRGGAAGSIIVQVAPQRLGRLFQAVSAARYLVLLDLDEGHEFGRELVAQDEAVHLVTILLFEYPLDIKIGEPLLRQLGVLLLYWRDWIELIGRRY